MEKQRIMLTGAHGFVGARALLHYPDAIVAPSELVRSAGAELADFVRAHSPDVIVNAAAISDIGACRENPEASYEANVILPVVLARAAAQIGAKLISFSSDQVYTGCSEDGPYSEGDDLPTPTNIYAVHKLEAERRVLDILPEAVMLRATWMYDMPIYNHANRGNFLVNTLAAITHGREIAASSSEYRGITYVRQVVELLDKACTLPGGVYNYGSENELNMLETTRTLLDALGVASDCVRESGRNAHNLWMDCSKLREYGVSFDTTAQGFARCVADYRPAL